ncbi:Phosphatidylinositol-4-phosphate 5-kinase [Entamoeba marina]
MKSLLPYMRLGNSLNFLNLQTVSFVVEPNDPLKIDDGSILCVLLGSTLKLECTNLFYVIIPPSLTLLDFITPFFSSHPCSVCELKRHQHITSLIYNNTKLTIYTLPSSQENTSLKHVQLRCLQCQLCSKCCDITDSILNISMTEYISFISTHNSFQHSLLPLPPCNHYKSQVLEITINGSTLIINMDKYNSFKIQFTPSLKNSHVFQQNVLDEIENFYWKVSKDITTYRTQITSIQKSFEIRKDLFKQLHSLEVKYLTQHSFNITLSELVKLRIDFADDCDNFESTLQSYNEDTLPIKVVEQKQPLSVVSSPITNSLKKPLKLNHSTHLKTPTVFTDVVTTKHKQFFEDGLTFRLIPDNKLFVIQDTIYFIVSSETLPSILSLALLSRSYSTYLEQYNISTIQQLQEKTFEKISSTITKQHHEIKINRIIDNVQVSVEVSVYFALQFHLLRLLYYKDYKDENINSNEEFIKSISHVLLTKQQGGKSKSNFFKTFDDCFLIKELQQPELKAFLIDGGSGYFNHVLSNIDKKNALVRILGVFTASIRFGNGKSEKFHYLVMENLYFEKRLLDIDELRVGLDGNLVRALTKTPIIVTVQDKMELMSIIKSDTQMLQENNVMDYSLIIGCNEITSEMWVGFIDFIRTYTWDKQLESVVKKICSLGENPTVIEPEMYRKRLLTFINSVFMIMPDETSLQ